MEVLMWSIVFHRPTCVRRVIRREESWRCLMGHVSAYGYTADENWVFYNPEGSGTTLLIAHRHDDVIDLIARTRSTAALILRMAPTGRRYRVPIFPPMTCAVQVSSLLGVRAFTPPGLRRTLLRQGAEIIHADAERTQGREGRSHSRAPSGGH